MAKLILTEAEKKAATYLEWDDAALGKAVKKLALSIRDSRGEDSLAQTACATMLVCKAADMNAQTMKMELSGVTDGEKQVGDWQLIVTKNVASKVVGRIHRKKEA